MTEVFWKARCQRTFASAHTYHINSISMNSDQVRWACSAVSQMWTGMSAGASCDMQHLLHARER